MKKNQLVETIFTLLKEIQNNLFEQARTFRQENTHSVSTYDEFKDILKNKGGFLQCGWDGEKISEAKIKEDTKATIRCILTEEKAEGINCVYSGNPAKHIVIFAKAY
jgi:prolyl-tRNA synthetase